MKKSVKKKAHELLTIRHIGLALRKTHTFGDKKFSYR